jgi:hypothetical protein
MSIAEEASMPQEDDFITVAGAAALAGQIRKTRVSEGTIRRWMDDPSVKVQKYRDGSNRVWVDRNDIVRHCTPQPVSEVGA